MFTEGLDGDRELVCDGGRLDMSAGADRKLDAVVADLGCFLGELLEGECLKRLAEEDETRLGIFCGTGMAGRARASPLEVISVRRADLRETGRVVIRGALFSGMVISVLGWV